MFRGLAFGLRFLVVGMLLAPAAGASAEAPSEVKLQYKIYKSGILIGNVSEHFSREGDRYRIVSATQTAGALAWLLRDRLTITSEGRIGSAGLEPTQYEFRREKDQAKNLTARFDWDRQQIMSQHDGKTENFDLPRGTLDRVSAMYQFMFNAPKTPEVLTWMSQGKKAERYVYRKQGEPVLTIGGIRYPTVHYARETKPGESHAELWLAVNMHYLPVRMVFEDSHGLALEQSLVSLTTE